MQSKVGKQSPTSGNFDVVDVILTEYWDKGIAAMPCKGKRSIFKHDTFKKYFPKSPEDFKRIIKFREMKPDSLCCWSGESKLCILDLDRLKLGDHESSIDGYETFIKVLRDLEIIGKDQDESALNTPITVTGSDGRHIYFNINGIADLKECGGIYTDIYKNGMKYAKIEIKNKNGKANLPPSCYYSKDDKIVKDKSGNNKRYKWLDKKCTLLNSRPIQMPQKLYEWLMKGVSDESREIYNTEHHGAVKSKEYREKAFDVNYYFRDIVLHQELVNLLSDERASNYNTWHIACKYIFCLDCGEFDNDSFIHAFSEKCPEKYIEKEVDDLIDDMKKSNPNIPQSMAIAVIRKWAKMDDPQGYDDWKKEDYKAWKVLYDNAVKATKISLFDDKYAWPDFVSDSCGKFYESCDEMQQKLLPDLLRVFGIIRKGGDMQLIYKNRSKDELSINVSKFYDKGTFALLKRVKAYRRVKLDEIVDMFGKYLQYDSVINEPFGPNETPNNAGRDFNLFPGFKGRVLDKLDMGVIQPILDHIREVICNDNEECYEWIKKYLAFIVKFPREKPKVALILYSVMQQIGKGVLLHFLKNRVYGKACCAFSPGNPELIYGKYNAFAKYKKVIILDEGKLEAEHYNIFKSFVTEPSGAINPKHVDGFDVEDYSVHIISTNEPIPIKISNDDMRVCIFECSPRYANEEGRKHLSELVGKINTKECGDMFMTYLMSIEGVDLAAIQNFPRTACRNDLVSINESALKRWLDSVKEGKTEFKYSDSENFITSVSSIFDQFTEWCAKQGIEKKWSEQYFHRRLKEHLNMMDQQFPKASLDGTSHHPVSYVKYEFTSEENDDNTVPDPGTESENEPEPV